MKKTEIYCDICNKEINPNDPHKYKIPRKESYTLYNNLRWRIAPKRFDICPECASKINTFLDELGLPQKYTFVRGSEELLRWWHH